MHSEFGGLSQGIIHSSGGTRGEVPPTFTTTTNNNNNKNNKHNFYV